MIRPTTFRELREICEANRGIIRQIVGRCHVGESHETVYRYVLSRMQSDTNPVWILKIVRMLSRLEHRQNRRQYRAVMWNR